MATQKRKRFKKILVANRGEIAIRILRAASELQMRTVAIYTYEDRYSLHRYKADESYQIGPDDEPLRPYIDIKAIIQMAKQKNVDAIHPGYGFLSENVDFARACLEAGIEFVGPSPDSMDQLGDKVAAKELARRVGVPLIQDSDQDISNPEVAAQEAERIGYPVIIKAAAGGGGRGMRVVRNEKQLRTEVVDASSEAEKAFGNGTIFLEKFIENPRHIEVQLLGDRHGNLVHLFERDCSVQRRFQKVVEVAPAANLSRETKDKLYAYALQLGEAVGYYCAGTVEFLVDQDESIYFIEVNPRIQVEHTVTEEITGIDLVRTQFLVTMGYRLDHPTIFIRSQEDIQANGFAVQCRVTTEDPGNNFKPDYGTLIAYRSASGMGIRLDAGSAFPGAVISPYFDSLLVKVTSSGRTLKGAAERLHRALREFRVRGVKTNIGFLLNLLENQDFQEGKATVRFIPDHPELMELPNFRDRGTRLLRYLADVIVNDNPDVGKKKEPGRVFLRPVVPAFDPYAEVPKGSRDRLKELGRDGFVDWLRNEKKIQYTDTTFRDAHQSLLATRMRMIDMLNVSRSYAANQPGDLFSMEVWGGATFDVALRFLMEDPWRRLRKLRTAIPNTIFQMLLRGSNGVGYKAYPDNLIIKFIEEAARGSMLYDADGKERGYAGGIDLFRIFDSLNWVKNMEVSIKTVRENTDSLAEACICYSGDLTNPGNTKFNLQYYIDLAKRLESAGAHILAIKDMAGLLKPLAAKELISALREETTLPIHLHTHDTSGIQSATYLEAINSGVDVVDVALNSLSGLTSQPGYNSIVAMMQGHERENPVDLPLLNKFADYFELVRNYYYPFETELRAGTATIYDTEIPGGQYSNLRPQARGLGLEEQFSTIRENYAAANRLFGNLVKVTPSSKVVGDMAMFMTSNGLTEQDVRERGQKLDFPDSVKSLMRGDLGQIEGGFDREVQKMVLKGEEPYTDRPNAHLEPVDFDAIAEQYRADFEEEPTIKDLLSQQLYPKVFADFKEFQQEYGEVANLPTTAFFYGLKPNEEILVRISAGKRIAIKYLNMTNADELGNRLVFFSLNGQTRSITVRDRSLESKVAAHVKAGGEKEVGSPLQGNLSRILVKVGDEVQAGDPLFVIEAMKMESTITSPVDGEVTLIPLKEKTLVEANDLVVRIG
ncbi:pyruvate carboxylase [Neolewinella xylanilytica]|uniref:Pyruvate carboxylase n=1 Tax=Neolewinella xylanilytica TaxID=1514080 RepID=A0A2S6I4Q9_9BACT|nr:pyruvate carboxylase [Neolewinella xylanilytica]PPK86079.1 pyruvate carboxylase [Neolewinella xylanilytica]